METGWFVDGNDGTVSERRGGRKNEIAELLKHYETSEADSDSDCPDS